MNAPPPALLQSMRIKSENPHFRQPHFGMGNRRARKALPHAIAPLFSSSPQQRYRRSVMKARILATATLALALFATPVIAETPASVATYEIDTSHTYLGFAISHL